MKRLLNYMTVMAITLTMVFAMGVTAFAADGDMQADQNDLKVNELSTGDEGKEDTEGESESVSTALTSDMVTMPSDTYYYTGSAIEPEPVVKAGDVTLTKGTDYTVSYSNNTNVGTATVVISAAENSSYTGTVSKTFTISKMPISKLSISGVTNMAYTGSARTLNLVLKNGSVTLKSGTDYTVKYSNNVKRGTAKVVITGKGNYTGSVTKTYRIKLRTGTLKKIGSKYYVYSSSGECYKSGWVGHGSYIAYATNSGALYTSKFITVSGNRYYVGKTGNVAKGIFKVNGKRYFGAVSANGGVYGKLMKNTFFTYKGAKYRASTYALKTKTFFKVGKYYYFAKANSKIAKSKVTYKRITVKPNSKTGAITAKAYKKAYKDSKNYVIIDLSSQKLWLYRNGKCVVKTSIVTGTKGHRTPTGVYRLQNKQRNQILRGSDYASFVKYWMPFIGNSYGLHDASWRSKFGGSIYKNNGSHGCVNLPSKIAKKIYKNVYKGIKITIRK